MDTGNYMANQMDNLIESGLQQRDELSKKVEQILKQDISIYDGTPIYELLVMRKISAERVCVRLYHNMNSELASSIKQLETTEREIRENLHL